MFEQGFVGRDATANNSHYKLNLDPHSGCRSVNFHLISFAKQIVAEQVVSLQFPGLYRIAILMKPIIPTLVIVSSSSIRFINGCTNMPPRKNTNPRAILSCKRTRSFLSILIGSAMITKSMSALGTSKATVNFA